ncbi:Golgi integral membrane protein 4-like [Pristis pectinata]|uniref:Golgi integral membrane protein 4-like n=1 Tax=Pristis pectinata TaxID=685728 RepID=UPI00223C96A5|nr:Golgi integral membrane protein 4-like [Pristis pectinata]
MGTPVNARRRILSREMSEDENVMIMIKEADAKFNARKASFAEAKETCVKKLVQQQQEIEGLMEQQGADQNTQEDFKKKYVDAVESIGHLETEKVLLVYEVERLKDVLEGTEEELAELHWKYEQTTRELETEKAAKYSLLQEINCMKEQLEERKKSEAIEITATENMAQSIQSNLKHEEYSDVKKMELKSDDSGKHGAWKLQSSAANLADVEQKCLTNSSFETIHHVQHKREIPEEIANGKHKERSVNAFTQGTADVHVKESTRLIKDGESVTVAEKVNHIHQCETERSKLNKVTKGSGSETLEPVTLGSKGSDLECKESKAPKGQEKEPIFEVSKVALEETAHDEEQSEDEAGTREQTYDNSMNTVEEEVRKQSEQKKTIIMEMHDGKNMAIVKGESTEVCGSVTGVLGRGEFVQDHGVTPGESRWEKTKERNKEAISSDKSYKELEMESDREDFLDGVARAHDRWMEGGRDGEEVTNQFRGTREPIPDLAKDGVSVNLKQDLGLDEKQQHGKEITEDEHFNEKQRGNQNPVRDQEMDRWLQSSIDKINEEAYSGRKGGENSNEKARLHLLQEDNADKEMDEIRVDLDAQRQRTVLGGSVQVEGKLTHDEGNTEENNGEREKGPFEMLVQMITTIIPQKSPAKSEGKMSRKDDVDGCRSEMPRERKEQNEEHASTNRGQSVGKEKEGLESPGDEYEEERDNDLSGKGQAESIFKLTRPEGSKAAREFTEEVEGVVDDPSDEEMHDAAVSMAPATCTEERKPDIEDDPESAPNNDDLGFGQSLNRSESTRRHTKNRDTCQVS